MVANLRWTTALLLIGHGDFGAFARDPSRPRRGPDPRVSHLLRASIAYGLAHRAPALAHAMQYGRDLDASQTDEFVGMYVNQRTLDYGADGRRAVQLFLDRGFEEGLIPRRVEVDFVEG
jgi:1,4-dihydroxy-6-naphthoate synthase